MKVRIEFPEIRSPYFKDFLRVAKRFPTFAQVEEDGRIIYSVDLEGAALSSLAPLQQLAPQSRAIVYYLDGQLVSGWDAMDVVWKHLHPAREPGRRHAVMTAGQILDAFIRDGKIPEG